MGFLGRLEAIDPHQREDQERASCQQVAQGEIDPPTARNVRGPGEQKHRDGEYVERHTETGKRPGQPGGGAVTDPTDSLALLPCSFCHKPTLQHYPLLSVTTNVRR